MNSECIKASWLSYRDKNAPEIESDLDIPSYFMITQCFENTTRESDVSKCESPPEDDSELLLPVTSSVTGRIYWNSYCARCNNDEADILPWIPTAKFNYDISYFINGSHDNRTPYPKTHNGVLRFIAELGNIIYTPPFPNEKKLCLRRDALFTCKSPGTRSTSTGWLKRACERIYSPVIIKDYLGKPYPFLNIFCYLFSCRNQYMFIQPSDKQQCGDVEYNEKGLFEGLTAILDYKALDRSNNDKTTEARQDKCHCDELYDVYLVSNTVRNGLNERHTRIS